jgi:hypothetical protein
MDCGSLIPLSFSPASQVSNSYATLVRSRPFAWESRILEK